MSRFEVIVQLKKEVLDPEGRAIRESLGRLGLKGLEDISVSKRFVLTLDGADPREAAERIARDYLANPVSQTFEIRELP